ncbi:hypothetical protein P8452_60737 [Trifolium repens]|nr:hypothetical protein P8452_60737 [Trifolium repens]
MPLSMVDHSLKVVYLQELLNSTAQAIDSLLFPLPPAETQTETWNGKRKFIAGDVIATLSVITTICFYWRRHRNNGSQLINQFAEVNRLGFGGLNCPIIASFLCMMLTMLMRSYEPRRNRWKPVLMYPNSLRFLKQLGYLMVLIDLELGLQQNLTILEVTMLVLYMEN